MIEYNQNGYIGQSMSARAVEAYKNGEKPFSVWTKSEILEEVGKACPLAQKLTSEELKSAFLEISSWHHTGKFANKTYFYSIKDESTYPTEQELKNIIDSRTPRTAKGKEQPKFYASYVSYTVWVGTKKHLKSELKHCIIHYMGGEKMVKTPDGNKRLSSLTELAIVSQKTKFASDKAVMGKFKKKVIGK